MAETQLPTRIEYPKSSFATGDLYDYLTRLALALNSIPTISFCSGNPNSSLTGGVGNIAVNIGSNATAILWVKQFNSTNTWWSSVVTA